MQALFSRYHFFRPRYTVEIPIAKTENVKSKVDMVRSKLEWLEVGFFLRNSETLVIIQLIRCVMSKCIIVIILFRPQ